MQNVNIEEIMKEIRADIKERGLEDTEIQFDDIIMEGKSSDHVYDEQEMVNALDRARMHTMINAAPELQGNPVSRAVKKVIRRLMAFHIEAMVDDQNEYNIYSYEAISMLPEKFRDEDSRLDALEEKLYESQKRIAMLEKQISEMQK